MARHEVSVKRSGGGVIGVCSCRREQEKPVMSSQEAEDWGRHHLEQVERAKAKPNTESLEKSRTYAIEQAENTRVARPDRRLWVQLADEADARLGWTERERIQKVADKLGVPLSKVPPPTEQAALF